MTAKERKAQVAEEMKKESVLREEMQRVTAVPEAKYMGPAKAGGMWFRNHKTGVLYRVDKAGNGYEVKETRKAEVARAHKKRTRGDGPTRNELMETAKAKKIINFRVMNKEELAEVVKPGTAPSRIKEIQDVAVKRWKAGWKSQKKGK